MEFFDLNIPYNETSQSSTSTLKTTRIKLTTKAMELGYTGIAYNRTIKGIMSDHDRCSISLLSLSSLLKLSPSLSSSVNFHRHLLNVPRASPFRQYTRLTVRVDSVAQGQVLNSGNPILKTYDLIAVRPLNQSAFDHACDKAVVDIISIDFSEKLPFRLKLHMVKAAIERGVYFEITYSDLIVDVQVRRQMISNAKLLVDWTRGRNLILSSAAPSVNELRGPYDVANLMSLLGLSMERAKAAISKNCRTLIANALRKKHFYKEAIRVEVISSGEQFDSKEPWSGDLLKWDPISSGEGDLLLDDMAKSFSAAGKVSKTVKAIDFAAVIDSMPSHGFQVKDLLSGPKALSLSLDNGKSLLSGAEVIEVSVGTNGVSEQANKPDLLPETYQTSSHDTNSRHQTSSGEKSPKVYLQSETIDAIAEEIVTHTTVTEEQENTNRSDVSSALIETMMPDTQSQKYISSELNVMLPNENVKCDPSAWDIELDAACNVDTNTEEISAHHIIATEEELKNTNELDEHISCKLNGVLPNENVTCETSARDMDLNAACIADIKVGISTLSEDINFPAPQNEESMNSKSFGVVLGEQNVAMEVDIKNQEDTSLALNDVSLHENVSEREKFGEPGGDIVVVPDRIPYLESFNEMKVKDAPPVADDEPLEEVTMEEPKHGEFDPVVDFPTLVQSTSGKSTAKQRTPHRLFLSPFKRVLNPVPFKKKAHKVKRRIETV